MKLPARGWIGARVRPFLTAGATAWAAAMAVTLPMQYVKIYSNAVGGPRDLLWSLAAGTLVWGIWTLAIGAGAWLCGGLPAIAIIREEWLLLHRRWSIAIAALLGWVVVLMKFEIWRLLLPYQTLNVRIFTLYSLLFVIFCGVSAAVYLRMVARIPTPRRNTESVGVPAWRG